MPPDVRFFKAKTRRNSPDYQTAFKGPILLRGGRGRSEKGRGIKGKGEGREEEVDGGIWPTQKISAWRPVCYEVLVV